DRVVELALLVYLAAQVGAIGDLPVHDHGPGLEIERAGLLRQIGVPDMPVEVAVQRTGGLPAGEVGRERLRGAVRPLRYAFPHARSRRALVERPGERRRIRAGSGGLGQRQWNSGRERGHTEGAAAEGVTPSSGSLPP